jgi:hypothetical protein
MTESFGLLFSFWIDCSVSRPMRRRFCSYRQGLQCGNERAVASASHRVIMWLEWRGDKITFIRDYRCARYVAADAELTLANDSSHHW